MATNTNADFDAMLSEYTPQGLFREELVKRDYFFANVEKDEKWLGDALRVRFQKSRASTLKFGSLPTAVDINQSKYARGEITTQPELWGALIFNEKDLMRHGKLSEQNFLKILPDEVEGFMDYIKMAVSHSFTNGHIIALATADGTAGGVLTVDRIERFEVGQPVQIEDGNTAAAKFYVGEIDVNANTIQFYTDVALTVTANLAAYTVAQAAKVMFDGSESAGNRMSNLKNLLLSAANGGDANLYGVSKLSAPYLQAINVSGSTISASNLLDKIFDAQTLVRNKGKGLPDKVVMSYKHLGSALKILQAEKGAFRQASEMKASQYGWTEIEIIGVKGKLTLVAIQEMNDDVIYILDMRAMKIYSNGGFHKRVAPDGKQFYEVRNTSGYQYIVDMAFMGDIVLERPSRCGIIHSIPNYS